MRGICCIVTIVLKEAAARRQHASMVTLNVCSGLVKSKSCLIYIIPLDYHYKHQ